MLNCECKRWKLLWYVSSCDSVLIRVRLPSQILSLLSSYFSVHHLLWQWLLTLLCTVAVKMQISQDSAFLFCWQFTVWRPHLLAAEQQMRVSAISILLSLGKMPLYLFGQAAALLSHCRACRPARLQAAHFWISDVWDPAIICIGCTCFKIVMAWGEPWAALFAFCRQITEIQLKVSCLNIAGK